MTLADYERLKFDLAALLRDREPDAARRAEHAGLLAALAEDRFNLVTVGRFNRGKSSLMNALLGTERLPMGIVPLTSVITCVQYGSTERATLYFHGTSLFMDIRLAELARHITEAGNPGNMEGIERAEIELPASLLRRGFRFIDTPGLGSSIEANTRTTRNFLPQADAFLVVTSFDSALSDDELAILHHATAAGARIFLAVNKSDLMKDADRASVLGHVAHEIETRFGAKIPIFPLSARIAMQAGRGDAAAWEASGVGALQRALVDFLLADKSRAFLASMASRIGAYFARLDDAGARDRLDAIVGRLTATDPISAAEAAPADHQPIAGCPICAAVELAVFDAVARLQAQLNRDHAARAALAERGCLCPPHAWQFEAIAGPLSITAGLSELIDRHADRLDATGRDPTPRGCAICGSAAAAQARAIGRIADRPPLVCLPHLPDLLARLPPARRGEAIAHQAAMMRRLAEDMRRFVLKREGGQRFAIDTEEKTTSHAAIALLAGSPHAYPPQKPVQDGPDEFG